MRSAIGRIAAGAALSILTIFVTAAARGSEQETVIRAKHVHTGTGTVLSPGAVLVRNGRIEGVAESISSETAEVIEVDTLMPGIIDAYAATGILQTSQELTEELTPELKTAEIINWNSTAFQILLADGCTTLHVAPGTDNVISGQAALIKTAGPASERVVKDATGLFIALCRDPASGNRSRSRPDSIYVRQPTNRMGVVWMLRNAFEGVKTGRDTSPVLQKALDNDLPLFAVSRTSYDIEALLSVSEEFELQPVVIGGQESWRVIEQLVENESDVVLQRLMPGSTNGVEGTRLSAATPLRLSEAGIQFCLSEGNLLEQARFAVAAGLPAESALNAITSAPAAILGIDDRVGSIGVGRDADLVALSGDPLQFTSSVRWVMVNGVVHFQRGEN